MDSQKKFLLAFVFIAIVGLALRYLATYNNIYATTSEPIFLAMIRQTIANNFTRPPLNALSGFVMHNPAPEQPLLTLFGAFPTWQSGGLINPEAGIAIIQIVFALSGMAITYLLAEKITGNAKWGLFSMLLFALQPSAIVNNALYTWSGGSFVPILAALSILLLLQAMKERTLPRKSLLLGLSVLPLAFSVYLWSGGIFAPAAYVLAAFSIIAFKQTKSLRIASISIILVLSIGWYLFINTGIPTLMSRVEALGQPSISNLIALLTQTGTIATVQNLLYAQYTLGSPPFSLLYYVPMSCGIVFSSIMIMLCLSSFKASRYEEKEIDAFIAVFALFIAGLPFTLYSTGWASLIVLPGTVLAGISLDSFARQMRRASPTILVPMLCVYANLLFILIMFTTTLPYAFLTPQYQGTMQWIQNNTPGNATFLTWAEDGSAIEGWANRTSYTDALSFDNNQQAVANFSRFLFAKAYNFSYLNETRPDYLLVRYYWYAPSGEWPTIEAQGGLQANYSTISGTNLQLFGEKPESINAGSISMALVYDAPKGINESIIYRISYR